jgi:translation initiation factor IF-3
MPNKNSKVIMNDAIRVFTLRVLDEANHNLGTMSKNEALQKARSLGLDLILTVETANPPIAKIIDYGKWKYENKKKASEQKAKSNDTETKVLRISVSIGEGDLLMKAKQGSEWLKEGHRVKVEMKLERRENYLDPKFLKEKIEKILILFTENFVIAEPMKKVPNAIYMVLEKSKKKAAIEGEEK